MLHYVQMCIQKHDRRKHIGWLSNVPTSSNKLNALSTSLFVDIVSGLCIMLPVLYANASSILENPVGNGVVNTLPKQSPHT